MLVSLYDVLFDCFTEEEKQILVVSYGCRWQLICNYTEWLSSVIVFSDHIYCSA